MSIRVTCSECQAVLQVADTARGKSIRCPRCKTVFTAGATAITPAAAKTDTDTPSPARKAARRVEIEEDDDRFRKKNNKSILPYLLMGCGLFALLFVVVGSIGGYFAWKGVVRLQEEAEQLQRQQRLENQQRFQAEFEKAQAEQEAAHQRFQAEFEKAQAAQDAAEQRMQADIEKAQAEHERHREQMQKRIEERRQRMEERRRKAQEQFPNPGDP